MNILAQIDAIKFIGESNRIEGIHREPTDAEIEEFGRFMDLDAVTIADMERFVSVYQPDAKLRDQPWLNVQVGRHVAPPGGPMIRTRLMIILGTGPRDPQTAYNAHLAYEKLHPFTDGNGRSGRMLWLWHMRGHAPLGFLHTFYYQTLERFASDAR